MAISVDVPDINGVSRLTSRLTHVVLADTNRWVLTAGAIRDVILGPGQTVISRNRDAGSPSSPAGRVRNVNRAVSRDLDVSVDPAGALRRAENRNAGTKRLAAVVAPRTLRLGDN